MLITNPAFPRCCRYPLLLHSLQCWDNMFYMILDWSQTESTKFDRGKHVFCRCMCPSVNVQHCPRNHDHAASTHGETSWTWQETRLGIIEHVCCELSADFPATAFVLQGNIGILLIFVQIGSCDPELSMRFSGTKLRDARASKSLCKICYDRSVHM